MWAAMLAMTMLQPRAEHLRILDLSGSNLDSRGNLRGAIPNAVDSWSNMERLHMSYQDLRGAIPNAVGSWSKMERLFLRLQNVSGPIPHAFGSMTALQMLDLSAPARVYAPRLPGNLRGAIPSAVGYWSKMIEFKIDSQILSGSIPDAVGSMPGLQILGLSGTWEETSHVKGNSSCERWSISGNSLRGAIPHAVGSWSKMTALGLTFLRLSGPIPDAAGSMTALVKFEIRVASLSGPIPHAVGSMTALVQLNMDLACLRGPIPHVIGSMTALSACMVSGNNLRGPIPESVSSMIALQTFNVGSNRLCGPIPNAVGSWVALLYFNADENSLCGPIPHAVGSWMPLFSFFGDYSGLSGPIPHVVSSWIALMDLHVDFNSLRGPIPHAVGSLTHLSVLSVSSNSLSGTIPAAMTWNARLRMFSSSDNQLSGSIPSGFFTGCDIICVHHNQFTSTFPVLKDVISLTASGNLFEGGLSNNLNSKLMAFDVSGVPGRSGGLIGPLPPALRQASELKILTIAHQKMYGDIPSFASTLWLLALHDNRLKVLPAIDFEDDGSKTAIFLYNNLLSCSVPTGCNATAKTSIITIGNRLLYPKGEFPAWVLEYEHDPLLWASGTDGMSFVVKISGAVGLFMFVVASKLGSAKVLSAMTGQEHWMIASLTIRHVCLYSVYTNVHIGLLLLSIGGLYCPLVLVRSEVFAILCVMF